MSAAAAHGDGVHQHHRARLGLARVLEIHHVGQLLPALDVLAGVFLEARDQAVASLGSQLHRRADANEGVLAVGKNGGQELDVGGLLPAAVGERILAAQKQDAAATPVDEILDEGLLPGRQIRRIHTAENDAVEGEQFLYLSGETVLEFIRIRQPLAIDLVLRGSQNGHQVNGAVVLDGAAEKLELPARLPFEIKDARLARVHVYEAHHHIVLDVLFAGERLNGRFDGPHARRARIE